MTARRPPCFNPAIVKRKLLVLSTFLVCVSAAASENFMLSIPVGEDFTRLVGEVRITLGLDAPAAGSQLVVNNTTVNLGQTVTVGGDSVTFEAGVGNSVKITYRPLSRFPTPGNFCQANAVPVEVPMRFSGTQDVVDYRISSYSVGAPAVECSQVFKRVGDFPALINPMADGVAPELTAIPRGRLPIDLVLVLDKSGSMSELPPEADSGPSKAEILKSALSAFVTQWRQIDAPAVDENGMPTGADNPDDRIGVVFFDSAAAGQMPAGAEPPANFFVPRGPSTAWNAVITTIQSLTPGGNTSIGGGLNEGMRLWAEDPDHDLAVIVVTDGKQNTDPLITSFVEGMLDVLTLTPVSGLSNELRKRFVPIQTIAFGLPAGVDQELLQNLSQQTNGNSFIAVNASTMFSTFGQTLVSILKGNTVSTVLQRNNTMTGAGPSAPETLVIDRSIPRFVVSLQWAPPADSVLDLEIVRPDGTRGIPTDITRLPQAVIARFDIGPADAGDWRVQVRRAQSTATQAIPYTLMTFVTEDELEYRVNFGETTIGTGDPIPMRVSISYDGKPLSKLPAGAVHVVVKRPPEALGTFLHENSGDSSATVAGDTQSAYARKVTGLTSATLVNRLRPIAVETLTLVEDKPGVYVGTFNGTTVPGAYAFDVVLDWVDGRTGHVRREEYLETQVKLRPVPVSVIITRADDGTARVAVTPRDRFGNYLGPGYEHRVKATLTGPGTISTAADPDQSGTYVFTVSDLPAGVTPEVTVTVDNVAVGSTSPSAGKWRAFVDLGPNFPHGSYANLVDGELSLTAGVERQLSAAWSLELILGYHRFDGLLSPSVRQLSLGAKRWFGTPPFRPFLGASAGAYRFEPGEYTRPGAALSGGFLYELSPKWGVEGVYTYHAADSEPDRSTFSTVQAGVRFAF